MEREGQVLAGGVRWRALVLRLPAQAAWMVSLGLLGTFAAVAALGIYAAHNSRISARRVSEEVSLSRHYEDARHTLATEESLQRQYRLEGLPTIKADFFIAGQTFDVALDAIARRGGADDRSLVSTLRAQHDLYIQRSMEVFDAADSGHPDQADRLEDGLDPLSQNLEVLINSATNRRVAAASQTLAAMNVREETLAWGMPVAFGIGICLTALLLLLLEAHRQARNAKSMFLTKMSHELRTPLNAILGFGQLLEVDPNASLDDRQRRYIANIKTGGMQLLALINDILDLSKVEAGQVELAFEKYSLTVVAEEALREMEPLSAKRGLQVELNATGDVELWGDRRRVMQVVLNGLSNAFKFTDAGGRVRVLVRTDADWAELSIEDSGKGIPREKLRSVFDEYAQVDHHRVEEQEGTGLGLPLSRRLTELMGGRLLLESVEGQGTSFHVRLRRSQPQPSGRRPNTAGSATTSGDAAVKREETRVRG